MARTQAAILFATAFSPRVLSSAAACIFSPTASDFLPLTISLAFFAFLLRFLPASRGASLRSCSTRLVASAGSSLASLYPSDTLTAPESTAFLTTLGASSKPIMFTMVAGLHPNATAASSLVPPMSM